MSIYPSVNKDHMIKLAILSEQQKNQRTNKIKKRMLKQTHNQEIAIFFEPVTNKLREVK